MRQVEIWKDEGGVIWEKVSDDSRGAWVVHPGPVSFVSAPEFLFAFSFSSRIELKAIS